MLFHLPSLVLLLLLNNCINIQFDLFSQEFFQLFGHYAMLQGELFSKLCRVIPFPDQDIGSFSICIADVYRDGQDLTSLWLRLILNTSKSVVESDWLLYLLLRGSP